MRQTVSRTLVLVASLALSASIAHAASLPSPVVLAGDAHDVTIQQVTSALRNLGYSDVQTVSKDGRIYEANAVWQGETLRLRVDAGSGRVTDASAVREVSDLPSAISLAMDSHDATIRDVRQALAGIGYDNVRDVTRDGQIFFARADFEGTSFDLRVATDTGRISVPGRDETQASEIPSPVILGLAPHKVSSSQIRRALADLGYTNIRNTEQDGRIFRTDAVWEGRRMSLRVDTRSGSVAVQ